MSEDEDYSNRYAPLVGDLVGPRPSEPDVHHTYAPLSAETPRTDSPEYTERTERSVSRGATGSLSPRVIFRPPPPEPELDEAASLSRPVRTQSALDEEWARSHEAPNHVGPPGWEFVEDKWFVGLSACVIVLSMVTMIMEAHNPVHHESCFWPNQLILSFFLVELVSRMAWYREKYLCGAATFAVWNSIDVVVVVTGVLGQWLLPLVDAGQDNQSLQMLLQGCRVFRLFRVARLVRIVMATDLSWTEEPMFQSFIGTIITLNSIQMGIETDYNFGGWLVVEQAFLCTYVFELAVRLKHAGVHFIAWKNPDVGWNFLDGVIVVSSVFDAWFVPAVSGALQKLAAMGYDTDADDPHDVGKGSNHPGLTVSDMMMMMRMMRLMRILRIVRLIKAVRPLYVLVNGVLDALQGVGWVLVLTLTVLYCLGILATRLIGHGLIFGTTRDDAPRNELMPFRTVPESMFTLFRVMSGAASDTEIMALDDLMADCPIIKIVFVLVMIATSWTLLSILTAVVSENMISSTRKQDEEQELQNAEEMRCGTMDALTRIFLDADTGCNGVIEHDELEAFCAVRENAMQVAKTCEVPVKDIKDMLKSLHDLHDHDPQLNEFVDCLVDVGRVATEKSLLRIEARIEEVQRRTSREIQHAVITLGARVQDELNVAKQFIEVGQTRLVDNFEDLFESAKCETRACQRELDALTREVHREFEANFTRTHAGLSASVEAVLQRVATLQPCGADPEAALSRLEASVQTLEQAAASSAVKAPVEGEPSTGDTRCQVQVQVLELDDEFVPENHPAHPQSGASQDNHVVEQGQPAVRANSAGGHADIGGNGVPRAAEEAVVDGRVGAADHDEAN